MASTYSDLKFELIGTGEQSGTWGTTTNTNLGTAIEEAITGSADVTFASATVTLTLTDTNASQTARNLRLNLTGTSGGAQDLVVPAIEKFYLVNNGCADPITVKVSGQTGVAVPAGKAMILFNNGTDVVEGITHLNNLSSSSATITGGTITGITDLAVADGGTGASDATTAQQNLGVEVGVDVQAYDAGLADIAGLAVTDGNFIVGNGANWVAESGATARTSLGLGSIATQDASSVSITGGSVTGITDLAVADGGTGASSFTANSALLGNGTSSFQEVAPGASGNVLTSNGTTWTSAAISAGGDYVMETFTSPGTWTKPANVSAVKVTVVGGGGSGGNTSGSQYNYRSVSGAGGSAGAAIEYLDAPSVPGPVAVTVGSATGTSSFGAFCSATGGGTGQAINTEGVGNGGSAGAGSGGNLNFNGTAGNPGYEFGNFPGSTFADNTQSSMLGTPIRYGSPARFVGPTGGNYGGGAGSSCRADSNTPAPGSAGAPGVVIVEYWS